MIESDIFEIAIKQYTELVFYCGFEGFEKEFLEMTLEYLK